MEITSHMKYYYISKESSVTLNCEFSLAFENPHYMEIEWNIVPPNREEDGKTIIWLTAGMLYNDLYDPLKGRVHFTSVDPQNGNASLTINDLRLTDTESILRALGEAGVSHCFTFTEGLGPDGCSSSAAAAAAATTKEMLLLADGKFLNFSGEDAKIHTLSYDINDDNKFQELKHPSSNLNRHLPASMFYSLSFIIYISSILYYPPFSFHPPSFVLHLPASTVHPSSIFSIIFPPSLPPPPILHPLSLIFHSLLSSNLCPPPLSEWKLRSGNDERRS
ncbi:hypothetical protein PAMP_020348 [Pampus punctatissimus]